MSRREWRYADQTLTTAVRSGGGGRALGRMKSGEMNRSEQRFAAQLTLRLQVGEILWWEFEGMKFKLGEACFYTPDFNILPTDTRELQCIDVKGRQTRTDSKGTPYDAAYYEDDAKVKIAAAASRFPIAFFMAFEDSLGQWILKEIGKTK